MKLDVSRARKLVELTKGWSPFGSTGRLEAEIGEQLESALEELAKYTQLRDGLIKLRDDIDEDRDCCSYTTEIDALLALAPKEPA